MTFRTIAVYDMPGDRLTPIVIEDLAAMPGTRIILGDVQSDETHDPARESFFVSQDAFLGRAFDPHEGSGKITILLRRQKPGISRDEWEQGLSLLSAVLDNCKDVPPTLVALTEEAARELSVRLSRPVDRFSGPIRTMPPDNRSLVRIDEQRALIFSGTGAIDLDAWNWARLRRKVHCDFSAVTIPDLADCCAYSNETAPTAVGKKAFLIVVPNGVGLGHLTRMLAVADALMAQGAAQIEFWCYSQGAAIIQEAGYAVHVRHTAKHLGCNSDDWHIWEVPDLVQTLRRLKPAAVITDGSGIDISLIEAIRDPLCGAPDLIWVRRGMWNPMADPAPLGGAQYASTVLVPGDLASAYDRGPTARVDMSTQGLAQTVETDPVTLNVGNEPLSRREARRALGLSRIAWRKTCLVSLGGDSFDLLRTLPTQITELADQSGVRLIWVRSPLARVPTDHVGRQDLRSIYPVGRYLEAFDGAITAVGYNSFHEFLFRTRYPLLLVPMVHQRLDCQADRARFASDQGWASWIDTERPSDIPETIRRFFADIRAGVKNTRRPSPVNGASLMARHILHHPIDDQDAGTHVQTR